MSSRSWFHNHRDRESSDTSTAAIRHVECSSARPRTLGHCAADVVCDSGRSSAERSSLQCSAARLSSSREAAQQELSSRLQYSRVFVSQAAKRYDDLIPTAVQHSHAPHEPSRHDLERSTARYLGAHPSLNKEKLSGKLTQLLGRMSWRACRYRTTLVLDHHFGNAGSWHGD